MKLLCHILSFCLWALVLPAQTLPVEIPSQSVVPHRCGTDIALQKLWQKYPHLRQRNELTDRAIFERLRAPGGKHPNLLNGNQMYTIPVVVHIIHNGGAENISDSQVLEGIRHINAAFSDLQPGASSNVSFVLCLAQQDETGRATNGITRTKSGFTDVVIEMQDELLKDLVRWNPEHYLNIWIVRSISSSSVGSGVVGYAMFPSSHGTPEDGLVIEADFFGASPERSVVGIHELGHYFGLYHTFEGGCGNSNCLLNGDRVCDTPPDASTARTACDQPMNSCSTDEDDHSANNPFRPVAEGGRGDQRDMISNFMDYSELVCQREFTAGQAQRMVAALLEIRSSLLSSYGCRPPCLAPLTASFSAGQSSAYTGETVTFTNTSAGATAYQWRVNDIEFSTSRNTAFTFTEPGVYIISMEASNSEAPCSRIARDTITVQCSITAQFTADNTFVDPDTEVHFTNSTGTGAVAFAWYVNGELQSTTRDYSDVFTVPGSHTIMLIASNDFCPDTAYAFVTVRSCGNKYDYVWYFGTHFGLDFSTEPPTILEDGAMDSHEACATMCTSEGQLLFYTDGATVWDRLHRIMPGGDSTLGGHHSSMQGTVIVPHPGNPSLYYIFTVDALENDYRNGLSYAVVDMTRNSGAGEVTDIVLAIHTTATPANVGESVTAISHENARDFWVVVRDWNNAFYSYLVSDTGVSTTPVKSTTRGTAGGILKFSPSGTTLVAGWIGGVGTIFKFDAATGTILDDGAITLSTQLPFQNGMEFSPDGRFLYITAMIQHPNFFIRQYDLTAGDAAAILASAVDFPDTEWLGNLQLAPNGKIYTARFPTEVGVINEPNKKGIDCDYQPRGVIPQNDRQHSRFGLPNFVHRRPPVAHTDIAGPTTLCTPATASYTLADAECDPIRWMYRGRNTSSFSDDSSIVHLQFDSPGIDTLIVFYSKGCAVGGDTVFINSNAPPAVSLGPDTALCSSRPIVLNAGPGFASYRWQDGSTAQIFTALAPGTYHVTVVSAEGCAVSDTITIHDPEIPVLDLGPDITRCAGDVVVLDAGRGFRRYRWQDESANQTYTAFRTGTYSVEAESFCGAIIRDTIIVQHLPATIQTLGDTILCVGGSVQLTAVADAVSFLWSPPDGLDNPASPSPLASPRATTTYTVYATTADGCTLSGSVTVEVRDRETPVTVRLPDTTATPGMAIHIPIHLDVAPDLLPLHIPTLRFTVRYRTALLMVTALTKGTHALARDGDYETISIELHDVTLTQSSSIATELISTVFLGDSTSTVLAIESISAEGCVAPVGISGQFAPSDLCVLPLRRVRLRDRAESMLVISPNPAADIATAEVTTSAEGMHTVAVCDIQGRILWSTSFVHTGTRATHLLPIELRDIPAGVYRVVLTSPYQTTTSTLSVVE